MLLEVTMMIMILRITIVTMAMIMKTIWILITIIATTTNIIILNHCLNRFLLNIYKHFLCTKRLLIVYVKNETISSIPIKDEDFLDWAYNFTSGIPRAIYAVLHYYFIAGIKLPKSKSLMYSEISIHIEEFKYYHF